MPIHLCILKSLTIHFQKTLGKYWCQRLFYLLHHLPGLEAETEQTMSAPSDKIWHFRTGWAKGQSEKWKSRGFHEFVAKVRGARWKLRGTQPQIHPKAPAKESREAGGKEGERDSKVITNTPITCDSNGFLFKPTWISWSKTGVPSGVLKLGFNQ